MHHQTTRRDVRLCMYNAPTIEAHMNSYTFDFVEITYEDLNMRDAPVRVEAYT